MPHQPDCHVKFRYIPLPNTTGFRPASLPSSDSQAEMADVISQTIQDVTGLTPVPGNVSVVYQSYTVDPSTVKVTAAADASGQAVVVDATFPVADDRVAAFLQQSPEDFAAGLAAHMADLGTDVEVLSVELVVAQDVTKSTPPSGAAAVGASLSAALALAAAAWVGFF